jgi:outer membrane lipoprotein SlyB
MDRAGVFLTRFIKTPRAGGGTLVPIETAEGKTMRLARPIASLLIVIACVTLSACADLPFQGSGGAPRVAERVEYGVIERIDLYREGGSAPTGLGAVLGGIAGGVIGHQIGGGRGNTVGTIAGALGGAYVGNEVQRSRQEDRYRIGVRLDNGARLEVEEVGEGELRVGDHVKVVNNRVYRD